MKTAEEIAQWVIDNRYSKSENQKVDDFEMYHVLVEEISKSQCNHSWVYKIMSDHTGVNVCEKCKLIENQYLFLNETK